MRKYLIKTTPVIALLLWYFAGFNLLLALLPNKIFNLLILGNIDSIQLAEILITLVIMISFVTIVAAYKLEKLAAMDLMMFSLVMLATIFSGAKAYFQLLNDYSLVCIYKFFKSNQANYCFAVYILPVTLAISGIIFSAKKFIKNRGNIKATFGSAEFSNKKDIAKLNINNGLPVGLQLKHEVTTLESIHNAIDNSSNKLLKLPLSHTTLIAPSGAGKGVGIIVPWLLSYDGPVFVCDPNDGENYMITKRYRSSLGRKVILIDPFATCGNENQHTVNPLDLLDPSSESIVNESHELSELLCPGSSNMDSISSHFQERARLAIQCMILYVKCSKIFPKSEQTLIKVYQLLSSTSEELLGGKKQNKEDSEEETNYGILQVIADDVSMAFGRAALTAKRLMSTDHRELSACLSTVARELSFLDVPAIERTLAKTSFNINDLATGGLDLFVSLPAEQIKVQSRFMRLMVGMVFTTMLKHKSASNRQDLLMVLDEFAELGFMQSIKTALNVGRKYGVRLLTISQSLETLQASYPKDWRIFLNGGLTLFIGCQDLQDCEYVSKKLGKATIGTESKSEGNSKQSKVSEIFGFSTTQTGTNSSESARDLLTADEVRRVGAGAVIVFYQNLPGIICKKVQYFNFKAWQGLWDDNRFAN